MEKKIAIKYDKKNWENVKIAVDLIRSIGQTVIKRKDEVDHAKDSILLANRLTNGNDRSSYDWEYSWGSIDEFKDFTILSMPEDMDKLKEALGVEVPKDGEVFNNIDRIVRFKSRRNDEFANLHSQFLSDGTFYNGSDRVRCMKELTKATPEETTKLIEAEHSNGWHWDGKALVEIPEYVKVSDTCFGLNEGDIAKVVTIEKNGYILNVPGRNTDSGHHPNCFKCFNNTKPSTREAYETQNMVRLMNDKAKDTIKAIKKPTKRIILNQYEAIEILVDEFEMVHEDGKILLTGKNK